MGCGSSLASKNPAPAPAPAPADERRGLEQAKAADPEPPQAPLSPNGAGHPEAPKVACPNAEASQARSHFRQQSPSPLPDGDDWFAEIESIEEIGGRDLSKESILEIEPGHQEDHFPIGALERREPGSPGSLDALLADVVDLDCEIAPVSLPAWTPSTDTPSASAPVLAEASHWKRPGSRQGCSRPTSRLSRRGGPNNWALEPGKASSEVDLVDFFDEREDIEMDKAMAYQIEEMLGGLEANILGQLALGGEDSPGVTTLKRSRDLTRSDLCSDVDYEQLMDDIMEDASPR